MSIKLESLNHFNKGKVTLHLNFNNSLVTYTYNNFYWVEDGGYLVMGDIKCTEEDVMSIQISDITNIVTKGNLNNIEIILTNGNIHIILDEDVSLCFRCKKNRPAFYMRAYGEDSEEYDVRICQKCFNKIVTYCSKANSHMKVRV